MTPNLRQAVPFFMVSDMDRSLDFYLKALDFELKIDWRPNGRVEWCWLERDGVALMLQEYVPAMRQKENSGSGISIVFICNNAIQLFKEFQKNGLKPQEPFVGNRMWVTTISDPDGYQLHFESFTDVAEETMYFDWIRELDSWSEV